MNITKVVLPVMGEGIIEAAITRILKKKGDKVTEDDAIIEVATDKVDTEIPSPIDGVIHNILVKEDDLIKVGSVLVEISSEGASSEENEKEDDADEIKYEESQAQEAESNTSSQQNSEIQESPKISHKTKSGKFLSPLIRSIAEKEGISPEQLDTINGTGIHGRLTAEDIKLFINQVPKTEPKAEIISQTPKPIALGENFQIIEMNRMRKIIADNMLNSVQTSPHVTSFIEADVTDLVNWRKQVKDEFLKREKQKLTFTPIFIQAVSKALQKFPMINISVDGNKIIKKQDINIGMATALPDGNLIVPVIKNTSDLSLTGLAKRVNDLSARARINRLKPDEIQGGTFTVTNLGQFGNISGTPIINQPEVAILALGAIQKKPAVIETPKGEFVGIRQIMILSLSYDHRVVDGALGGAFLQQIALNLQNFEPDLSL